MSHTTLILEVPAIHDASTRRNSCCKTKKSPELIPFHGTATHNDYLDFNLNRNCSSQRSLDILHNIDIVNLLIVDAPEK